MAVGVRLGSGVKVTSAGGVNAWVGDAAFAGLKVLLDGLAVVTTEGELDACTDGAEPGVWTMAGI